MTKHNDAMQQSMSLSSRQDDQDRTGPDSDPTPTAHGLKSISHMTDGYFQNKGHYA